MFRGAHFHVSAILSLRVVMCSFSQWCRASAIMRSIHLSPADSQIFRSCRILYAWGSSQILKRLCVYFVQGWISTPLRGFYFYHFPLTIFFLETAQSLVQGPRFVCALEPPGLHLFISAEIHLPSIVLFSLATRYKEPTGVMVLPSTRRLSSHIDQKTVFLALKAMSSQISKPLLIPKRWTNGCMIGYWLGKSQCLGYRFHSMLRWVRVFVLEAALCYFWALGPVTRQLSRQTEHQSIQVSLYTMIHNS